MHLSLYTPPMASSIPNLRRLFAQEKVEIEHFYSTLEMSSYQNRDFFLHFDHRKSQCLKIKKEGSFRMTAFFCQLFLGFDSCLLTFYQLFIVINLLFVYILSAVYCHHSDVCLHFDSCLLSAVCYQLSAVCLHFVSCRFWCWFLA